MELIAFINDLRSAYVEEFVATFQRESSKEGSLFSEVGFQISGAVYKGIYVVDFVRRIEGSDIVSEIGEVPSAVKGPAEFKYEGTTVVFDAMSWDAANISTQPILKWNDDLEAWFEHWLDVEKSPENGEVITGIIHSVTFVGDSLQVDFGTAAPDAAMELIGLLHDQGAEVIRFANARE